MESQLKGVSKAISNLAQDIEEDYSNEEEYEDERIQIIELLKQKEIEVQEIVIYKKVDFYRNIC